MTSRSGFGKLWVAYLTLLAVWLVVVHAQTLSAFLSDQLFVLQRGYSVFAADFLAFYNGGSLAWDAVREGIDIYDPFVQKSSMEGFAPGLELERVFFSQYPPYVFALFMPLALLSLEAAWLLWVTLGACGIAYGVHRILSKTFEGELVRSLCHVAVFAAFPTWLCIRLGQVTLLAFPFFALFWIGLARKRWFKAGLAGGVCLVKLQYMPIMFLVGLALGGARFAAGYAAVGVLFLGSSAALFGWETWLRYPEALRFAETSPEVAGVAAAVQQNLRGQLALLPGAETEAAHAALTIVWLLTSLGVALLWWRVKRTGRLYRMTEADGEPRSLATRAFLLLASATVLVQLVVSPHTHAQDFLFATLPCIWLAYTFRGGFALDGAVRSRTTAVATLTTARILLVGFPVLSWAFYVHLQSASVVLQPFLLWSLLVLLAVLVTWRCAGNEVRSSDTRRALG